jgi:hypothetical protein
MTTVGKFTLFTFGEFYNWLAGKNFIRVIKLVQNHHTYIPGYKHFKGNNHFQMLNGMEQSHLERGFNEIAQNITTFPDGTIAICRSIDKIPAGIKGANQNGICIEHIGSFDANNDNMTEEHRDTIIRLNAALCKKFSLVPSTDTVVYHHWYDLNTGERKNGAGSTKTCPGTAFFGGNTVEAAQANFIPLVSNALNNLSIATKPVVTTNLQHAQVNASILNVRAGAGMQFQVSKTLQQGTTIAIYEAKNGWFRISETQQWVKGDYVTLV